MTHDKIENTRYNHPLKKTKVDSGFSSVFLSHDDGIDVIEFFFVSHTA